MRVFILKFQNFGPKLENINHIILKYLRPYHTMDKKLSVISSSVTSTKISISWYPLNIFIDHDSRSSQASSSDSLLPGILQTLQLRRQTTLNRMRSLLSELRFTSTLFWLSNRLPYCCSNQEMILSMIYVACSRR